MVKNYKLLVFLLFIGLVLGSCVPRKNCETSSATDNSPEVLIDEDGDQNETLLDAEVETPQKIPNEAAEQIKLPALEDLQVIDVENAYLMQELAVISPDFPPYYRISADGRIGAIGSLQGIDIISIADGALIEQIPVDLPVSDFGVESFFQFNEDGSFIAVASRNEIQVWQVGGGLVYTSPISRQYNTTGNLYGAEIPQLALSPDGTLLAVSAVDFSDLSTKQYFRVIDILKNRVVYEWDGSDDTLHGYLYTYPGLGFSADGSVLQTFDPAGFAPLSGTAYEAFRFWSTSDWQELDSMSGSVQNAFSTGDLLFALQNDDALVIQDRRNGSTKYSLGNTGCFFDYPCDVKMSVDGRYAALIDYSQDTLHYRRDILAKAFQIWDLEQGKLTGSIDLYARNLDGVILGESGAYQIVTDQSQLESAGSIWWTSLTNFMGLTEIAGRILFSPQTMDLSADTSCYFCGTCELDLEGLQVSCAQGFISQEGNSFQYALGEAAGESGSSSSAEIIELPDAFDQNQTARMLGISEKWQRAFYCLDQDQRQQVCSLYDLENETILADLGDVYMLRISPDGDYAAFIDREEKALFVAELESGIVKEVSAYQSRAWLVNPAFGSDGMEMVYMIQNLSSSDVLSLEWVQAEGRKVLRRSNLEVGLLGEPSVLAWSPEGGLVAVGNTDGWVYLLEQEKGKLIHSWQVESEDIIGALFVENGKLLVTVNRDGVIRIWGILK